jgi:c-di-GMP-binding flagellar brake protein YcgR
VKLPEPNLRVEVTAESSNRPLFARVEDVQPPTTVLLGLPTDGVTTYALSRGEQIELRWLTERGTVLITGRIVGRSNIGVPVLEIGIERMEVLQRRSHVRAPVAIEVEIEQASAHLEPCVTVDLSGGGIRIHCAAVLTLGEKVFATLFLPEQDQIDAEAWVVRCCGEDEYALEFTAIEPADRERLIHFVFGALRTTERVEHEEEAA